MNGGQVSDVGEPQVLEHFVGQEAVVVALGDSIIKTGEHSGLVQRVIASHVRHGSCCTIAVCSVPADEVQRYGIVKPKERTGTDFEIEDIIEKPPEDEAPSRFAVAARYVFNPEIFTAIEHTAPGAGGELQLTDAIRILLKMGHEVRCVKLTNDETRYDIGNPESYFRAFMDFALADPKYGYLIRQYLQKRLREI